MTKLACLCTEPCTHTELIMNHHFSDLPSENSVTKLFVETYLSLQEEFLIYLCNFEMSLVDQAALLGLDTHLSVPISNALSPITVNGIDYSQITFNSNKSMVDLIHTQILLQKIVNSLRLQVRADINGIQQFIHLAYPNWGLISLSSDNYVNIPINGTDPLDAWIFTHFLPIPYTWRIRLLSPS